MLSIGRPKKGASAMAKKGLIAGKVVSAGVARGRNVSRRCKVRKEYLTDEVWARIEPLLPELKSKGRPYIPHRPVVEGILWVLRTGAPWADLPRDYPAYVTCWRRHTDWGKSGVWQKIWAAFLSELNGRERLNWEECQIDGSFAPSKKGATGLERPSAGRARNG